MSNESSKTQLERTSEFINTFFAGNVIDIGGGNDPVIANAEGARTTPSIVAFTKSGERLVGAPAKRQGVLNPDRTYTSIKRHMGTDYRTEIDGVSYTPEQISAMVLQKLKSDAEAYLGESVTKAVITVPAYFNDAQRTATKNAGEIAGLEVLRIINEPTAAALAYGMDKKTNETILVYDLGGGTFDVSILEVGDGVFEVKSTSGDTNLGGDDFDQAVLNYLADEFQKDSGINLRKDKQAMQRLREASEKAKIELSSSLTTNVNLPFITADADGPKHLDVNLSRAKFDDLTSALVVKTKVAVNQALKDAKLNASEIDEIILVKALSVFYLKNSKTISKTNLLKQLNRILLKIMQISVLTESDQAETRVAITPDVAKKIIVKGVDVVIQSGCGEKSNYTDQQYEAVGAKVTRTINESVLKSTNIFVFFTVGSFLSASVLTVAT